MDATNPEIPRPTLMGVELAPDRPEVPFDMALYPPLVDSAVGQHEGRVIKPNPELIRLLHEADSRIGYFSGTDPRLLTGFGHVNDPEHYQGVMVPLARQIKEEMGTNEVVLRGGACSINGSFECEGLRVRDIREIVKLGDERGRHFTHMGSSNLDDEAFPIHDRVAQYARTAPMGLRIELSGRPELAERVFPVILVYDEEVLNHHRGLPADVEERNRAVQKAYILDYID